MRSQNYAPPARRGCAVCGAHSSESELRLYEDADLSPLLSESGMLRISDNARPSSQTSISSWQAREQAQGWNLMEMLEQREVFLSSAGISRSPSASAPDGDGDGNWTVIVRSASDRTFSSYAGYREGDGIGEVEFRDETGVDAMSLLHQRCRAWSEEVQVPAFMGTMM